MDTLENVLVSVLPPPDTPSLPARIVKDVTEALLGINKTSNGTNAGGPPLPKELVAQSNPQQILKHVMYDPTTRNARNLRVPCLEPTTQQELGRVGWGPAPTQPEAPPKRAVPEPVVVSGALKQTLSASMSISPSPSDFTKSSGRNVTGMVRLQTAGWITKTWRKRYLVLERTSGLSVFSSQKAEAKGIEPPLKSFAWRDITRVVRETLDKPPCDCFVVFTAGTGTTKNQQQPGNDALRFSAPNPLEADSWRSTIATCVLVDLIAIRPYQVATGVLSEEHVVDLLPHFADECHGDVNATCHEDIPLLIHAVRNGMFKVAEGLLRRNADVRKLLRIKTVNLTTTDMILSLLEKSNRDLNATGDDVENPDVEGGWTLLHHMVARRNVQGTKRLLPALDKPTICATTNLGETALSLALKTLTEHDNVAAQVEMALDLLKAKADPGFRVGNGDNALHMALKRTIMAEVSTYIVTSGNGGGAGGSTGGTIRARGGSHNDGGGGGNGNPNKPTDLNQSDSHGDCPIHLALRTGQGTLARLIANDPRTNLDLRDGKGDSPLILAMRMGDESFALLLLTRGADGRRDSGARAEVMQRSGSKSMNNSLKRGERLSKRLSAIAADDPFVLDMPIHLAIKLGMNSLALKLAEFEAVTDDRGGVWPQVDAFGRTALLVSILYGMLQVSMTLISRARGSGAYLNARDPRSGDTALHLAIRMGRIELALCLIDAGGVNLDQRNEMGETPLMAACGLCARVFASPIPAGPMLRKACIHLVDYLMTKGAHAAIPTLPVANVDNSMVEGAARGAKGSRDWMGGQTCLHKAATAVDDDECSTALVEILLSKGSTSLAELRDAADFTVLGATLAAHKFTIARKLLGVTDVDAVCGQKLETPLHLVVRAGNAEMIPILLQRGAYVSSWDAQGLCPLHAAICMECTDGVTPETRRATCFALIEASPFTALNNRTETTGLTPLMLCVQKRDVAVFEMLLEAGADARLVEPKTRCGVFEMVANLENKEERHGFAKALLDKMSSEGSITIGASKREYEARSKLEMEVYPEMRAVVTGTAAAAPPSSSNVKGTKKILPARGTPAPNGRKSMGGVIPKKVHIEGTSQTTKRRLENDTVVTFDGDLNTSHNISKRIPVEDDVTNNPSALQKVKTEADITAKAYLRTEAGISMLQRRAMELQAQYKGKERDQMSFEAAKALAERLFVQDAIDEARKEFLGEIIREVSFESMASILDEEEKIEELEMEEAIL